MDTEDAQGREEEQDTGLLPMTEEALEGKLDDGDSDVPESERREWQDASDDPGPVANTTDFSKADLADNPNVPFQERVEETEQ